MASAIALTARFEGGYRQQTGEVPSRRVQEGWDAGPTKHVRSSGSGARLLAVCLAVGLVVLAPVSGLVAGSEPSSLAGSVQLQQATPTPANDTRHEHPDRVDQNGDLSSVKRWLAGRMGVQLESCLVEVGLGTTNVCELQDEYPEWVSKYVDVADDTASEEDDERGETYEQAAEDAETYSESVSEFSRTYEEYQEAREAGETERARRLARELLREQERIANTGGDLVAELRTFEAEGGVNLGEARENVNETTANVTEIAAEIEEDLFVATRLNASIRPSTISFLRPGTVAGRLVAENGTAVANEPVRLAVGERTYTTETDAEGRFAVEYRPTTIPVSTEQLTVRYLPRNESVYLGSNATVNVSISQVEPTVSVSVSRERARFGDTVRVTGTVGAEGVPAPDIPVVVTVDGRTVGTVRTDADGAFAATVVIAAADGPGEVAVQAGIPLEDRALASAAAQSPLTIRRSPTALTIEAESAGPQQVAVEGTLRTANGDAVAGQTVAIEVNGTAVESVRTGPNGSFDTTVDVPASLLAEDGNSTVRVVAAFDGSGTNLEGSADRALVVLPAAGGPPGDGGDSLLELVSDPVVAGLLGLAGLVGLLLLYWFWRRRPLGGPPDLEGVPRPDTPDEPTPETEPAGESAGASDPLAVARERLGEDVDGAVMLAYGAVRESLADTRIPAGRDADTHWEFLAACRADGLDDDAIEGLTGLTEAYERAAYAPVSVSRTDAESALESAAAIV